MRARVGHGHEQVGECEHEGAQSSVATAQLVVSQLWLSMTMA